MNGTQTTGNGNYANDSMTLLQFFKIIGRHLIMIVVLALLFGGASFSVAKYGLVPTYTASTQILVNQKHASAHGQAFDNQQADVQMINTYKQIITNHRILTISKHKLANPEAEDQTAYNLSYSQLKKMVNVKTSDNSQVFDLNVKAKDPKEAAVIANTVTNVFQKQIKKMMGFNNVTVASRAVSPSHPSFPNVELFTIGGALLGLIVGCVIAVVKELEY